MTGEAPIPNIRRWLNIAGLLVVILHVSWSSAGPDMPGMRREARLASIINVSYDWTSREGDDNSGFGPNTLSIVPSLPPCRSMSPAFLTEALPRIFLHVLEVLFPGADLHLSYSQAGRYIGRDLFFSAHHPSEAGSVGATWRIMRMFLGLSETR